MKMIGHQTPGNAITTKRKQLPVKCQKGIIIPAVVKNCLSVFSLVVYMVYVVWKKIHFTGF
jgi:hypothetical protein